MDHNADLTRAARLLDHVKLRGFTFHSDATDAGGPLIGHRVSEEWEDTIHMEGFTRDCVAWRHRVDDDGPAEQRVEGSALTVLTEALTWDMGTLRITKGGNTEAGLFEGFSPQQGEVAGTATFFPVENPSQWPTPPQAGSPC